MPWSSQNRCEGLPSARMKERDSGCAEGTSQIAQRNSLTVFSLFPYVQFGTSLLHIRDVPSALVRRYRSRG